MRIYLYPGGSNTNPGDWVEYDNILVERVPEVAGSNGTTYYIEPEPPTPITSSILEPPTLLSPAQYSSFETQEVVLQ